MIVAGVGDAVVTRRLSGLEDPRFTRLIDEIANVDAAYVNFEQTTPRLPATPEVGYRAIRLGAPDWTIDELSRLGFNLFGLANNHSTDYTFLGVEDTLAAFSERELASSGCGRSLREARMPCYLETPHGRISMISVNSTYAHSSLAADGDLQSGPRAGINPLRYRTEYCVASTLFDELCEIDEALGTAEATRHLVGTGIFPLREEVMQDPDRLLFMGKTFKRSLTSHVQTTPLPEDLDAINKWINHARYSSDVVVVGLHAHESPGDGLNQDAMADFIPLAARSFIDAGADIVFGHGPHRLRGIEVYQGRPIFYSLGNFMFQDHSLELVDPIQFEAFGLDRDSTPAALHRYREITKDGRPKGFHADEASWEAVAALCEIERGNLRSVRLLPIVLDRGLESHSLRGVPLVAKEASSLGILQRLSHLSEPFGVNVEVGTGGGSPIGLLNLT